MSSPFKNLGYNSIKTQVNNNNRKKSYKRINNTEINNADGYSSYNSNEYKTVNDNMTYYISLVLLIYFGSKIFYGINGLTPKQPLNNELTNFITMIILSQILFYLNNFDGRNIFSINMNNSIFYFGLLLGTIIPYYYHYKTDNSVYEKNTENESSGYIKFLYLLFILFIFSLNILNSFEIGVTNNYFIRIIVISIILYGIYSLTQSSKVRKVYKDKNVMDKELSEMEKKQLMDEMKKDEEYEKGGGSQIKFDLGLSLWLLLLLFPYSSPNPLINEFFKFVTGILLSGFITDVALYGVCYPIINDETVKCKNSEDCRTKGIEISENVSHNISENITRIKYLGIITFIIILFVIIYLGIRNF